MLTTLVPVIMSHTMSTTHNPNGLKCGLAEECDQGSNSVIQMGTVNTGRQTDSIPRSKITNQTLPKVIHWEKLICWHTDHTTKEEYETIKHHYRTNSLSPFLRLPTQITLSPLI